MCVLIRSNPMRTEINVNRETTTMVMMPARVMYTIDMTILLSASYSPAGSPVIPFV